MVDKYTAVAVQTIIRHVREPEWRDAVIRENVNRYLSLMEYVSCRWGQARLYVLPEFSLTGVEHVRSVEEWTRIAVRIPGPELEPLANFARINRAYVAGGTMEYDPAYPNRWFNSAYLFGPSGDLLLRYRKVNGADVQGHTTYSTPTGLYDLYVKNEGGEDALFPVVDTEIGRLALINCYDINFPEMPRIFAQHGAEILLHCTGEPYGPHREPWEMSRRTRAYENCMYVISSNHGGYAAQLSGDVFADSPGLNFQERRDGEISPLHRSHGGSEIVDFNGKVAAQAPNPGEALAIGPIDLRALREKRMEIRDNILVQSRTEIYAREYTRHKATGINRWLETPIAHKSEARQSTEAVIARYLRDGVYTPPEGYQPASRSEEQNSALT